MLSGFGMTICGGSYPASQGEHLISHHIEMMPPLGWEPALHGEQIVIARGKTPVSAKLLFPLMSGLRPVNHGIPIKHRVQTVIEEFAIGLFVCPPNGALFID